MKTGDKIKKAREAKGLTQTQVGEALGYKPPRSQIFVAQWEAGSKPVPRARLKRVAEVLGLNVADMLP